jgi:AraC-like DNA-binding protein
MAVEQVLMWRHLDHDRVLLMAGETTRYAMEPCGEYVFGIVARQPMLSRRGREDRVIEPGQVVAWDPSGHHSGRAVDDRPWSARLMVIDRADLALLANDEESELRSDLAFPDPVIRDPSLARAFVRMHRALETTTTRLERDERLTGWLRTVLERFSTAPPRRSPLSDRDDRALRAANDYLADRPERNVCLDELAAAAGIGKFRLVRLFRERTGLPPHALHIGHRIRVARRLLEAGETIAATAAATGFADQSHLHRHFQRSLGLTPGEYRRRFRA